MATSFKRCFGSRGLMKTAMYPEADSQSYKTGDFVTLSSGKVASLASTGASVTSSDNEVLGVVLRDARNTTSNTALDVPVLLCNGTEFLVPIYAASGSNAEQQDVAVGTAYTIFRDSNGVYGVTTTSTNGIAQVVEKLPNLLATDQWEPVWVKILNAEVAFK